MKVAIFIALSLALATGAFFLGPVLWPHSPDIPAPTPGQVPFLIALSAIEALAFGLGVSFLAFGYGALSKMRALPPSLSLGALVSISWLLANWWIHDSLHLHVALELGGLIQIEYGFHFTLILAGLVLAYAGARLARASPGGRAA